MDIFLALNDQELQTTTAKLLRIGGHNPCKSTDTNMAEAIKANWIEFLLADLNLEPSGAEELVAVARAKYPKLPILLLSGGEFDGLAKKRVTEMRVEFLQRPHTAVVLVAAINRTKLLASEITIGNFWQMMALSEDIFFRNYNPSIPEELKARKCFLLDFQQRLWEVSSEIMQKHGIIFNILSVPLGTVLMDKSRRLLADLTFWLECQKIKL